MVRLNKLTARRFGVSMLKMGVTIVGSLLHQIPEPALAQAIFVTHGEIATHLIDRNLENESRFWSDGLPYSLAALGN